LLRRHSPSGKESCHTRCCLTAARVASVDGAVLNCYADTGDYGATQRYNRSEDHMPRSSRNSLRLYVAGAVAEAAIEDLRANLFNYSGFPQITVSCHSKDVFDITLSWETHQTQFQLTDIEAKAAAQKFKSGTGYERSIFDKVQKALAAVEAKVSADRTGVPIPVSTL
jgi:hypothetical protein